MRASLIIAFAVMIIRVIHSVNQVVRSLLHHDAFEVYFHIMKIKLWANNFRRAIIMISRLNFITNDVVFGGNAWNHNEMKKQKKLIYFSKINNIFKLWRMIKNVNTHFSKQSLVVTTYLRLQLPIQQIITILHVKFTQRSKKKKVVYNKPLQYIRINLELITNHEPSSKNLAPPMGHHRKSKSAKESGAQLYASSLSISPRQRTGRVDTSTSLS